jgi:hypothetical protein
MQSAFVELESGDDVGAEVTLLGAPSSGGAEIVREEDVASAWGCTPHNALLHLCGSGKRAYGGDGGM